jgi:hypothetical protein
MDDKNAQILPPVRKNVSHCTKIAENLNET